MNNNPREHIALITGANAGIGLELTRKLLAEDWQVIALTRSDFPSDDKQIGQAAAKGQLRVYKTANLADYAGLHKTIKTIKEKERRIDVLFNNAGGSFSELSYSSQGRELHYELMTVVPYILLNELKELIASSHFKTVINTSSSALNFTKKFNLEILEHPKTFRKLLGPYSASKLALSLWTEAVAPQLAKDQIKIRSVDPGSNNTLRKGKNSGLPLLVKALMKLFFPPPTQGAGRLYEGAFGEHREETGVFLMKGQIAELKFRDQANAVLERVHTIYQQDYLQIQS
ncbi:short-chain dehydrogenase [Paenibacillus yonginensis]|uniref:Short-chain dehydrogenase n=1 Tax=Paenibacillus yonginensis TaxID=1462996 RepID=A0A1B1MVQ1_9BACL|nr:SDR family NAD(P)-dependent oxidoreductase [Paenibacillus yonginensis]ANS73263.1 short-chain dehydrogenase [Paenibacillus yonginensis]